MPLTAQDLIDRARIRHWSFTEEQVGDGAALLFLSDAQRAFILERGAAIEGLFNTTVQIATTTGGTLVGVDANGNPQYLTTYADGWPVELSAAGNPYVDFAGNKLTTDPFGQNGGTPGWPLPVDFLKLLAATLVLSDGSVRGCAVVMERDRTQYLSLPGFRAFISGNRLIPLRSYATASLNSGDLWTQVTGVNLSYIVCGDFTALTTAVTVPTVVVSALIAGLAWFFARQSPKCSALEKRTFEAEAAAALESIGIAGLAMLNEVVQQRVQYRG